MTIEKNISYVPNLYKSPDKSGHRRPCPAACQDRWSGRGYAETLSQRTVRRSASESGHARALMNSPKIILMDEPFGAVDEITRRRLQEEILRIHEELGGTIVFVTHDIKEALKLGSRVLVMDHGHIIQDGSPTELLEHPATDFVRRLVAG